MDSDTQPPPDVGSYRARIELAEHTPNHVTVHVVCPRCGGPWWTILRLGDEIDITQTCARCRP